MMIDVKQLPKKPIEAFKTIIVYLKDSVPGHAEVETQAWLNRNPKGRDLKLLFKAAEVAARRIPDPSILEAAEALLPVLEDDKLFQTHKKLDLILDTVYVSEFEDHFLNEDEVTEFDKADLTECDKSTIRAHLATARKLTENADFLTEDHKKRVIYRIADVENELFKKVAGYKSFLAAAAETIGLVKKFGEDAKPLAEAIEQARTVTERKVEGYNRIEAEEKPKQLPKPETEEVS